MNEEIKKLLLMERTPTNVDMGNCVKKAVESLDWLNDDLKILDYWLTEDSSPIPLVEYRETDCFVDVQAIVNTGGSEGIYVDAWLRQDVFGEASYRKIPLMTLKTLERSLEAYASMGRLSGIITVVGEWFLNVNWKVIEEKS